MNECITSLTPTVRLFIDADGKVWFEQDKTKRILVDSTQLARWLLREFRKELK